MKRAFFLLALAVLLSNLALAESIYPTTISGLETTVKLHGYGAISGLKSGEEVVFQTLTFQDSPFQKVPLKTETLYINGKTITPSSPGSGYFRDEFGNKYVEFRIRENGDFNYEIIAQINTSAMLYALTDYDLSDVPASAKIYTAPSEKVESDSTEIMTLAESKLPEKSFLLALENTISWVNGYVEYARDSDYQRYYLLQRSAVETLLDRKGVCDEFSNLAAALLRAKGIPTKLAIGITYDGEQWGNHAWIEVYHKDLGWVPSDPTFMETGFVDGTHLRIGAFSDVSLSLAKALFPKTANVYFQTQTVPEVTINAKSYFSEISVTPFTSSLKSNQWNEYRIAIKNNTGGALIAPIRIRENYKAILTKETTKGIALEAGQSAEAVFWMYPQLTLGSDEVAKGTITINTLNMPYDENITITNTGGKENGTVDILDITPIASENRFKLVVTAGNYFSTEQPIDINVSTDSNAYRWHENIPAFSKETYVNDIDFYGEKEYTITASTPTEQYRQLIRLTAGKLQIIDSNRTQTTTIIQKIALPEESILKGFFQRPEIIILSLLAAVAAILFMAFLTKKRYV